MTAYHKHLVIVGTARSGTSWLSELIARQYRYRLLFEPEHYDNTKQGHLLCDQWLKEEESSSSAERYLNKVFKNRVDNDWIAQNSNRKLKRHLWPFIPKKYIIKFVRINLAAQYINKKFKIPVLHILRSPYDVVKSQKRSKFPWILDLSIFVSQKKLVDLIKNDFNFDISDTVDFSEVELMTIRWCIENVIPLELWDGYENNSMVLKYEDLTGDISLFHNMCSHFNLDPIKNVESVFFDPSSKTHPTSTIRTKKKPESSLSSKEISQINSILDIFETSLYPRLNP